MKLSLSTYIATTLLLVSSALSAPSTDEKLAQQARALLRPASRVGGSEMLSVKRRSEQSKLASRRAIATFGIIDPRSDSGMPLPMQMRARIARATEEADVEEDFDCSEEEGDDSSSDSTLSGSASPAWSSASSSNAPAVTSSPSYSYPITETKGTEAIRGGFASSTPASSSPAAASTSASSTTTATNGSCTRYHTVVTGEICLGIINYPENVGLSLSTFLAWNPSVNADCTNLEIGQTLCVSQSASQRQRRGSVPARAAIRAASAAQTA